MHEMMLVNQKFLDINPVLFGRMKCTPGFFFGPEIRTCTLIHYVEKGCGVLYKNNNSYPVKEGQAFIILKGETTTYVADQNDPWEYRWIGFTGALSDKYADLPPIINISEDIFPNVLEHHNDYTEYVLASQLFRMTAELFSQEKHISHHIHKVKNYIRHSFMNEISVERIAAAVSLDRHYLSRIFKEETGTTIQQYIIKVRMKHACDLLSEGMNVLQTAMFCGYSDLCNFSRMFKRQVGLSPKQYQKSMKSVDFLTKS